MAITLLDVRKEYTRDKNLKEDDVKSILNWVKNRPHLPEINEIQAVLFLQKSNYQKKEAQRAIDSFFTFKTSCSDICLDRNLSNQLLKQSLDVLLFTVIPKKTPEGYSIIFTKVLNSDITKWDTVSLIKYFDMVTSLHLHENGASKGYISVMDLENFPLSFVPQLELPAFAQFFELALKQKPWKIKEVHYFNNVPFMDQLLPRIEPLLGDMKKFLYLHKTVDDLVKQVPREYLPKDYGGSAEPISILHEKNKERILENAAFFKWEDKQMVHDKSQSLLDSGMEYERS